ncbi:type I-E CRISPR-associated protein Cse2/CasB [Glycomyces mayteni]|uniref:Type I-E CRISPR-associated protein Cse2/CasB n=1 Tax=Glycomyces mayteni TaxID=543887 RepID=A0ABW2DDW3_9ACTN
MTDTLEPAVRKRPRHSREPEALGRHVASVVDDLQRRYLRQAPAAIAALAQLRQAVNAEPGTAGLDAVWLPDALIEPELRSERAEHPRATPSEQALHTAVTLFAIHQQSQREQRMHTPGTTFAVACQWLAAVRDNDETVHRRFAAVGTAATYPELVYHVRNMVTQLRAAKIGFDYGVFADDLRLFQRGPALVSGLTGADHVRALWGREYWRASAGPARPAATDPDASDASDTADPSTSQE